MDIAPNIEPNVTISLKSVSPENFVDAKELLDLQESISQEEGKFNKAFSRYIAIGLGAAIGVGVVTRDLAVSGFIFTMATPAIFFAADAAVPSDTINELKDKLEERQKKIPQLVDSKQELIATKL